MWSSFYSKSQSSSDNANMRSGSDSVEDDVKETMESNTIIIPSDINISININDTSPNIQDEKYQYTNNNRNTETENQTKESKKMGKNQSQIHHDVPFHFNNEDDSPNLFDEISISTKDSLGPTAFIEPIFDLQAPQPSAATNVQPKKALFFDENKSIHDSECVQMYHGTDDEKKSITKNPTDIYEQNYDCENNDDYTTDEQNKQNKGHDTKMDKEDYEKDYEKEQSEDDASFISYDSFQRIAKRAFLKSRVQKQRQELSSKISILHAKSSSGGGFDDEEMEEEEEAEHGITGVNEDVFLGLGNLMYREHDDDDDLDERESEGGNKNNEISTNPSPIGNGSSEAVQSISSSLKHLISAKNLIHMIITMSFVLNFCNYLTFSNQGIENDNEDYEAQNIASQLLMKDAMNLFLIYTKLNKVQDEVMKFHMEKEQQNDLIATLKIIVITFTVVVVMIAKTFNYSLRVNKRDISNDLLSPTVSQTTKKKSLQKELTSLDKKNIFPSTISTVEVLKDGTLAEVRRTMRFSPEPKRSNPSQPSSMKKVSTKQRPTEQQSHMSGMGSPGIFSPRFQNMKALKKEIE